MTKEQPMTNQERRYTLKACECGERWLTAEGKCWAFDGTGRGCTGEAAFIEIIDCAALEALANEWEARAKAFRDHSEPRGGWREARVNARADEVDTCVRELRALTQPTEPDHKEGEQ